MSREMCGIKIHCAYWIINHDNVLLLSCLVCLRVLSLLFWSIYDRIHMIHACIDAQKYVTIQHFSYTGMTIINSLRIKQILYSVNVFLP